MQNFKEFKRARETFELLWFRRSFKGNEVTKTVPQMNDTYSLTNLEEAWSVFCFIITTTIVPFRKDTQKKRTLVNYKWFPVSNENVQGCFRDNLHRKTARKFSRKDMAFSKKQLVYKEWLEQIYNCIFSCKISAESDFSSRNFQNVFPCKSSYLETSWNIFEKYP